MKGVVIGVLIVIILVILFMRKKSYADPINAPAPSPVGPAPGQQYYFVATPETECPPGYYKPAPEVKPKICQLNNS